MQSFEFVKAWRELARKWQEQVPLPGDLPAEPAVEAALLAGDPLSSLVQPVIEPALFGAVLVDLAAAFAEYRQEGRVIAAALKDASPTDREGLAADLLEGRGPEAWTARQNLDSELVATLAGLALQPFMARFAKAVTAGAPISMWRQTHCPVCGSPADVCRIDPDNLRFLHCPQCDTQWEHHRMTCPVCDTDDIKRVNIITLEEMEPWRVEVCDVCGGYMKTLDQRHGGHLAMPKVDLYLEDARTLQLDLIAEQEGYRRGGRAQ